MQPECRGFRQIEGKPRPDEPIFLAPGIGAHRIRAPDPTHPFTDSGLKILIGSSMCLLAATAANASPLAPQEGTAALGGLLGGGLSNDDCSSPTTLEGLGSFEWNNESATTSGFNGGSTPEAGGAPCYAFGAGTGSSQAIAYDQFFVWTAPCDGNFVIDTFDSSIVDTKLNVHRGTDCSATCVEGDDDDGPGLLSVVPLPATQAGDSYLIQVGVFAANSTTGNGLLNILRLGGPCPTPPLTILCDPANDHFGGTYVDLSPSTLGPPNFATSGLHLAATGGPIALHPETWGYFITSLEGTGNTLINRGILCLGDSFARYNHQVATLRGLPQLNSVGRFDTNGEFQNFVGTGSSAGGFGFDVPFEMPFMPNGQTILPGDTLFFQLWYRDVESVPGDSSNFSNMLRVSFPPPGGGGPGGGGPGGGGPE